MTSCFRNAYRFFHKNAGYIVGEKALCAFRMARAEANASSAGVYYEWTLDDHADASWYEGDPADLGPAEVCTLFSADGEHLASCGGIFGADRQYHRVMEAELALEAGYAEPLAPLALAA
jgi:hypothetical protein